MHKDHDQSEFEARLRLRIEAELAELLAQSRSSSQDRAPVSLDQQSIGRLSRMDALQMQAMAMAAERRRQVRIAGLRKALTRIDAGEFGYCDRCGEAIPAGRLEIDTTARFCVGRVQSNER